MTDSTNNKVIKLEVQMANVVSEIAEVKALVKEVSQKIDHYGLLDNEVASLKHEISELKKKTFRNGWVFPTLSAVFSSIVTLLILFYLSNVNGG